MNKKELVAMMAEFSEQSKASCEKSLDAFIQAVGTALKNGDEVRLVGFGIFHAVKRNATEGRNPRTGAVIKIPASTQPKFKAGKSLKDEVN
ncbi:MAG: HU family DNA-binding protein [Rickettsiales bacterium]